MEKIIDLHIHTTMSDGALTPIEVIDEAVNNGVDTIAIADHDTIDAYTKELFDYAKDKSINIINAVEISTKMNKVGIHVLGYNFDINNKLLKDKLFSLRNARHDYLYNVNDKLSELGYVLNVNELDKIDAVTKAHIALDIINNSINKDLLLKTFGYVPSKGEFIETIMSEGCPAFVEKTSITPIEAANLIRNAGGKVVLAHPVAYSYEDNLSDEEIISLINEIKPDGIEADYIYIDRYNNKINDIDKWNKIASNLNLMVTIGSDFHNMDDIHPKIGLINEDVNINNSIIDEIIDKLCN